MLFPIHSKEKGEMKKFLETKKLRKVKGKLNLFSYYTVEKKFIDKRLMKFTKLLHT